MTGFTFGKYLPFHKGHAALIQFGLTQCDRLLVLVCASEQEALSGETRAAWIRETFAAEERVEVRVLEYDESELTNSSVSSRTVSQAWARVFTQWVPEAEILFTSELYGDFVAEYMGLRHQQFDPSRERVPISATRIREDMYRNWAFLPAAVQAHYCRKVVLLGTESTGKSTLAEHLATHFQGGLVAEAGRELIPDSRQFGLQDLYRVAEAHAQRIYETLRQGHQIIFLDTDVHITQSYARHFFQQSLALKREIYVLSRADLALYLGATVPFVQDGTRLEESQRNALDLSHRQVLAEYEVPFMEIGGNWAERTHLAKALVAQRIT